MENNETYDFDIEDLEPHPRGVVCPPAYTDTLEITKPKRVAIIGLERMGTAILARLANMRMPLQNDVVFTNESKQLERILERSYLGEGKSSSHIYNMLPEFEPTYPLPEKIGERKPLTKKQRKACKAKRRTVKQSKRK